MHVKYNYSATQNNGQILSQQDALSGETISYQYDSLKRLIQASATGDPSGAWSQAMAYDGFGNLTQKTSSNAPALSVAVNYNTNRIQTNASYDADGDLTGYAGDGYGYDLRNRMVQANPAGGGTVLYGYDTTNHRIYKGAYNNGTYSAEEIYFYGVEGHKYGTWQLNPSSGVLLQASVIKQWFGARLVSPEDRLGSKGKYFAFGEERTNVSPANPPNDQEKFATYTRDSATGLDYADQRYYSSLLGRFNRPDPSNQSVNAADPQSWNRYAYVENDPANAKDPTGLFLSANPNPDDEDPGDGDLPSAPTSLAVPPTAANGPLTTSFGQAQNRILQALQTLANRTSFSADCLQGFAALPRQESDTHLPSALSDAASSIAVSNSDSQQLIANATTSPLGKNYQLSLDTQYAQYLAAHNQTHLTVAGYFDASQGLQAWTPYQGNTIFIDPDRLVTGSVPTNEGL